MPGEWHESSLGDLIDVKHGFAFQGEFIHDESRGDVLLTPGNFAIGGGFKGDKFKYFDGPVPDNFVLAEGDLLVTMTDLSRQSDTLGLPAFVPARTDGRRYLHNQRLGKVLVKDKRALDTRYLHYLLCSASYRHEVLASATGTTVKHTSPERIQRFKFSRPPLPEQRAIAHILGTLDDKIELNRRMNETLEAMARAHFKSWFVDFDPVRAKAEGRDPGLPQPLADLFPDSFEDSELGAIPRGWDVGTIGSIASRVIDKVENPAAWAHTPLIDLGRMPQKSIALGAWGAGAELTTSVTRFCSRDTLFGAIRPYFHKVGIAPMDGVTNVSVFVLRAKHSADWSFLTILCSMADVVDYATRVAKGTKMPVVSWPDFQNYAFAVPPGTVRAAFGLIATQALERICNNVQTSRQLATIRDSLLPKLISGELRVESAGIEVTHE